MNVAEWKKMADAMVADFNNPVFENEQYTVYDHKGFDIDYEESPVNYLTDKNGLEVDDDLEDEIHNWSLFSELGQHMPKSVNFKDINVLGYVVTGFTGSFVSFRFYQFSNYTFLFEMGDDFLAGVYRIAFRKRTSKITDFVFDRFVTDRHAGRGVPSIDLAPISFNDRYVDRKQFRRLFKAFLKDEIPVKTDKRVQKRFLEALKDGVDSLQTEVQLDRIPAKWHDLVHLLKQQDISFSGIGSKEYNQLADMYVHILTQKKTSS